MKKGNKIFTSTKNTLMTVVATLAVIGVLIWGTTYASDRIAESKSIGSENALRFALADAGIDPSKVKEYDTDFERLNGEFVYDVDFEFEDKEYEYHILASDGKVVSREFETNDRNNKRVRASITEDQALDIALKNAELTIGTEKAKSIALSHAGLSSATFSEVELDSDDGVMVYELEFYSGNTEYDYEINAKTGSIIEYDSESED